MTTDNPKPDRATTYEDPWLVASLVSISGFWRLRWGDGHHESWNEWFPEYHLGKLRLAELVALDHAAGEVLTPIKDFYQTHVGHGWYYVWKRGAWHEFMQELRASGFACELFNSGGGIYLVQTQLLDDRLLVWFDDHEGYARMGIYAVYLDGEVDSEGGMVSWPEHEDLNTAVASEATRILNQITWAGDGMARRLKTAT